MLLAATTIFAPLLSSIICGLGYVKLSHRQTAIISVSLLSIAAISAIIIFNTICNTDLPQHIILTNWLSSGTLKADWSIYIDRLSSLMLVIVCLISAIVHLYSIDYMADDPHITRFMAYLSLFTFFMLLLITADNFLQLFCGWEGVGGCSYLLIGFWYKKRSANQAAIKAFVVNRIADMALVLAICLIYNYTNTISFTEVFNSTTELHNIHLALWGLNIPIIEIICLLIFIGCMGKSAQIGYHIWLPDAMEGPTPVSALIHAATMVTAGVFLVVKCAILFEQAIFTLHFIIIIGSLTCLFAGLIATVQTDIKKIIAYSTCSQLGYMFIACGVSAYNAAMFHLFTHAFFKALLFLLAGSVIHATDGEQDIRKMGNLKDKMPITYYLFWLGSLAIAGIFPLAGYFSKDLILEQAYLNDSSLGLMAYCCGVFTALLTAFYSFRLIFMVFHAKSTNHFIADNLNNQHINDHTHDSTKLMAISLYILAIGAAFSGIYGMYYLNIGEANGYLAHIIPHLQHDTQTCEKLSIYIKYLPTSMALLGISIAYLLYETQQLKIYIIKPLYSSLLNKFYVDELYEYTIMKLFRVVSCCSQYFDVNIIDRLGPDGFAKICLKTAKMVSRLHTGYIFTYAFYMLLGLSIPMTYFVYNIIKYI